MGEATSGLLHAVLQFIETLSQTTNRLPFTKAGPVPNTLHTDSNSAKIGEPRLCRFRLTLNEKWRCFFKHRHSNFQLENSTAIRSHHLSKGDVDFRRDHLDREHHLDHDHHRIRLDHHRIRLDHHASMIACQC